MGKRSWVIKTTDAYAQQREKSKTECTPCHSMSGRGDGSTQRMTAVLQDHWQISWRNALANRRWANRDMSKSPPCDVHTGVKNPKLSSTVCQDGVMAAHS